MTPALPSAIAARPRAASALLWGAVGALTFLVLVQGYALVAAPLVTIAQGLLAAAFVGAATAACAYLLEHRIAAWAARRARSETDAHGGDDKSKS